MNKTMIVALIRQAAKKQGKTFKSIGEYAGLKSTYINKILSDKNDLLPSDSKLMKIAEYLNIKIELDSISFYKKQCEKLKSENAQLKKSLKRFEKLEFLYTHYAELEKLMYFLDNNKGIFESLINLSEVE